MSKQAQRIIRCGILVFTVTLAYSCTTDKEIKADIATKAKTDINFAAVNYSVENKIVTLTGSCPSQKSVQQVAQTIKSINVISGLINNIKVAPVTLDENLPLKQAVDSLLADYPTVQANVNQGTVELYGKAPKQMVDKLLPEVYKLHPVGIQTKITDAP